MQVEGQGRGKGEVLGMTAAGAGGKSALVAWEAVVWLRCGGKKRLPKKRKKKRTQNWELKTGR
ncbi:hypothetical protein CRD18_05750 [Corynebacterium sp. LK31]|nr:hypothetical protein [Corynebacterium sp. LK31]OFK32855.1 hypothetical protein HMPREF2820_04795 [Corynebacterium sp. HMSC064E08]